MFINIEFDGTEKINQRVLVMFDFVFINRLNKKTRLNAETRRDALKVCIIK